MARQLGKRDKHVQKMGRDGLVDKNLATGEEVRVSQRERDFDLRQEAAEEVGVESALDALFEEGASEPERAEVPSFSRGHPPLSKKRSAVYRQRSVENASQSGEEMPARQEVSHFAEDFQTPSGMASVEVAPRGKQSKDDALAQDDVPDTSARRSSKLEFAGEERLPQSIVDRGVPATSTIQQRPRPRTKDSPQSVQPKHHLHFEGVSKSSTPNPAGIGADRAVRFVHSKVQEAEGENVGVEAAHKGELAVEGTARKGYRMLKNRAPRPNRHTTKLRQKAAKETYRQILNGGKGGGIPQPQGNTLARAAQKRQIRKKYARMARSTQRKARQAAKAAAKAASAPAKAVGFVVRHPILTCVLLLLALLIVLVMSLIASCSGMATGGLSSVLGSTYLANDADIDAAELAYTEWETDLLLEIANTESIHTGYDEYRYNVDDIAHNPHELMAFLTSVYQDFTADEAMAILREVFEEQYTLTFTPETETRYHDPDDANEDGDREPYDWHILNVTLTARSFTDVIAPRIGESQREIADLLMTTYGNRQYLVNPFDFNWLPRVTTSYGWRVHPDTGQKDFHTGVDIAVAAGTPILAGHDGVVVSAGNEGSYGQTVVLLGEATLMSRYAHCGEILVAVGQEVKKGDVIATVGSPHLHFEVMRAGEYLNPLYFAETGDDGSGRLSPGTPDGPAIPDNPGEPMGDGSYAALIEEAEKHLGKPYVFGASGPEKFDCSGFICYVLRESGVADVGRTTAQGLFNLCTPVSAEDARPGDLVFFQGTYSTSNTVTHVGIVTGDGQMLHCGKPVQYASFETAYWKKHFYSYGRP